MTGPQLTPPQDPSSDWEAQLPSSEAREAALCERLRSLDIAWTMLAHAPVFTVEEAKNLRGKLDGLHTKNLFLKDKSGGLWLVVAREELNLDLNALSRHLGVPRFSFGKPALMAETLGITPGAVTPFALMNDIDLRVGAIFDKTMMAAELLNFHPLRNDKTMAIAARDLMKFAEATGHVPRLVELPQRAQ